MLRSRNPVRNVQRYWEVQTTFLRYGLGFLVDREELARVRPFLTRGLGRPAAEVAALSLPERVRLLLQELGPTYVKLGQVVSSQSYILPEEWLVELRKLQNEVDPAPYADIRQVIVDELGASPETLFLSFEERPLAAASIGQVHRAVLRDGTPVVVKVQRPGIKPKIEEDLAIMHEVARFLARTTTWARNYDVVGIVEKFGEGLSEELDYTVEARYADRLREVLRADEGVRTPRVYWDLITARVLTMEFIAGVKISNVAALDAADVNQPALADRFIRAMVRQILIEGLFHADPHPGNVFVIPATAEIVFLDTGMMDRLSADQRADLSGLMVALNQRDAAGVVRIAIRLGQTFKPVDQRRLTRITARMIDRYLSSSLEDVPFGEVVAQLLQALFANGIRLSAELTLAVKALVQMEQISRTLNPAISIGSVAASAAGELLQQRLSVDAALGSLREAALELASLGPDLRDAAAAVLEQLKSGRPTVSLESPALLSELARLDDIANRATISLTLTGMTIGSAITLRAALSRERDRLGSVVGYAGAASFALSMLGGTALVGQALWDAWRKHG
ncbi:MAG: AarF/ABC1/UbiB kinase family protein [Chloroflexales bacterium]|nr:AarF/ABC1/UbiB kinase family protein [Chloroflexales bacterium]